MNARPTAAALRVGMVVAIDAFTAATGGNVARSVTYRAEAQGHVDDKLRGVFPSRRGGMPAAELIGQNVSMLMPSPYRENHARYLTNYLTTGEKETRAWTIRAGDKAPAAAGVIHSDFERGFIRAEVTAYDDLIAAGEGPGQIERGGRKAHPSP